MAASEVAGAEYLGCYVDNKTRLLDGASKNDTISMTAGVCKAYCDSFSYRLYGLEFGSQCYCGDNFTYPAEKADELECDRRCSGNQTAACGGKWFIGLYNTTSSTPSSSASVTNTSSATPSVSTGIDASFCKAAPDGQEEECRKAVAICDEKYNNPGRERTCAQSVQRTYSPTNSASLGNSTSSTSTDGGAGLAQNSPKPASARLPHATVIGISVGMSLVACIVIGVCLYFLRERRKWKKFLAEQPNDGSLIKSPVEMWTPQAPPGSPSPQPHCDGTAAARVAISPALSERSEPRTCREHTRLGRQLSKGRSRSRLGLPTIADSKEPPR